MTKYKAVIYFDAEEDDFNDGLIGNAGANWTEEITANTKKELRERVEEITYTDWQDITQDNCNEYDFASEYWASYLTNDDNLGKAYNNEVEAWKAGKLRLWCVNCHILVSKVSEERVLI